MARKSFSRRVVKRTRIKLSPKDAETLFRQEMTDSQGNKHINIIRFKPQNPFEPDFKQTVEYKDKDNNK